MFAIEDRGVIFNAADHPSHERIAYFTSLCPLRSGALLCGFQLGPIKHAPTSTVRLCRSDDEGRTWRELPARFVSEIGGIPGSLAAAELVEAEPGRLLLFATWFDRSDPTRPIFDPVTEGILHSKQLLAVSSDDGDSWSDWAEIPTPGLAGCAMTGPAVIWEDGTIGFAFESFKEFDDPRPGRHAAWLMTSTDGGRTFSAPRLVAQHPEHAVYYWDQRLCTRRTPGEFLAMFWTHHLVQQRDLPVHLLSAALQGDTIVGTPIRETPIPGQIAAPLLLDDGRLLAFVVDRGRPGTMTLWCSPDGGTTWPEADRLVVHTHEERANVSQGRDNVDFKEYWEDMVKWSFGHPAIRPLADHRVLVAYYAGTPDCMSLHWARIGGA